MAVVDCALGETLHLGEAISMRLLGMNGHLLYVYVDTAMHEAVEGSGFHACVPNRLGRADHVLAIPDRASFTMPRTGIAVAVEILRDEGATPLRAIRLRIDAPQALSIQRQTLSRSVPRARRWSC